MNSLFETTCKFNELPAAIRMRAFSCAMFVKVSQDVSVFPTFKNRKIDVFGPVTIVGHNRPIAVSEL